MTLQEKIIELLPEEKDKLDYDSDERGYNQALQDVKEKLKFLEADKDSYYEILVDIHDRLRKAI